MNIHNPELNFLNQTLLSSRLVVAVTLLMTTPALFFSVGEVLLSPSSLTWLAALFLLGLFSVILQNLKL